MYVSLLGQPPSVWTSYKYCPFAAPPRFRESSERLSVRKGDRAVLECAPSAGDAPMDLFWRRNGIDVMRGQDARFAVEEAQPEEGEGEDGPAARSRSTRAPDWW